MSQVCKKMHAARLKRTLIRKSVERCILDAADKGQDCANIANMNHFEATLLRDAGFEVDLGLDWGEVRWDCSKLTVSPSDESA
jgi:hypothetical protein